MANPVDLLSRQIPGQSCVCRFVGEAGTQWVRTQGILNYLCFQTVLVIVPGVLTGFPFSVLRTVGRIDGWFGPCGQNVTHTRIIFKSGQTCLVVCKELLCPPPPPQRNAGLWCVCTGTKPRKKIGSSVAYKTIGTFLSQK